MFISRNGLCDFRQELPAMEKTWRYVCTMTTHPNENTRRPWRQVRLSFAAGSVLMILLPLTIGLNASKHRSQNPEKVMTRRVLKKFGDIGREREREWADKDEYVSTTFTAILFRYRILLLEMLRTLLDQFLAVFLSY